MLRVRQMTHKVLTNMLPQATLTNGLVVMNFSSPHTFKFEDGTVLDKYSDERSDDSKLVVEEVFVGERIVRGITLEYIYPEYSLSSLVYAELFVLYKAWTLGRLDVDIIILPLPVGQQFVKEFNVPLYKSPFACVRLQDRTHKIIFDTKYCDIKMDSDD